MTDYNFWADLLDTFQTSPDWIKALWLLVPPGFLLALLALAMRLFIESKRPESGFEGELIYSVRRDGQNRLHILSHAPRLEAGPALLLLDPPMSDEQSAASIEEKRLE